MKKGLVIISTLLAVLLSSCGDANMFAKTANQGSDAALFQDALKKIDAMNWSAAITIMTSQLSSTYRTRSDVKEALMGAYLGKCGVNFFDFLTKLSSASGTVFNMSLSIFSGVSADPSACDSAATILQSLGDASSRTNNQNFYGAMIGIAKIAANLHSTLDTLPGGIGNGVIDAGYDLCIVPTDATHGQLTDAQIKKIIVGLGLLFENLSILTTGLGSSNGTITAINTLKTQCEAFMVGSTCTITSEDNAVLTASYILKARKLIASVNLGLGTCNLYLGACCP